MRTLRTPEERFIGLPGFDWLPRYAELDDFDGGVLRMAYVDAGPADGPTVLALHGEPSWSFLYRHVIAELVAAGIRVVAPDLVGFGRSDKPAEVADHTYRRHIGWVAALAFDTLDLRGLTLLGQDWGGLIGLRLVAEHPDRFDRVVAANTGLPSGDTPMPEVWWRFRHAVQSAETLEVSRLVRAGCVNSPDQAVLAAYDAPFPDESFKAGPRAMPLLVPTTPEDPETPANRAAWAALGRWDKPFLVAFSDSDPITGPVAPVLRRHVPGAAALDHPVLTGAGHFLQEDAGAALGRLVAGFVAPGQA